MRMFDIHEVGEVMAAMKLVVLSCLLLIIAWNISLLHQQDYIPFLNYDGNCYFPREKVHSPLYLKDIQSLVSESNSKSQKIKVLGTGHSRSPIALSEDLYISLHAYRGLVNIDTVKKLATFRGGSRLKEILNVLESYNLTLPVLPAIDDQTIGGALATGTHGSSSSKGNMALYIQALQLVIPSGEVLVVTSDTNSDLFHAAAVGLGVLGVVTEVTLKCVKNFNLIEIRSTHSLSYCRDHLFELATGADYVKFWFELNSKTCYLHSSNVTTESSRDVPSSAASSMKMFIWELFQWTFSVFPSTTATGMALLFSTDFFFSPYNRVDHSWNIQIGNHYMSPNNQAEIAVAMDNCVDALDAFIAIVDGGVPVNHILEVRFVKGDDFWLSNNYKRDSCHLTVMLYNPSDVLWEKVYMTFYQAILKYKGRPHWGKSFSITTDELHQLYPKMVKFLILRQKLDPKSIFLNEFMRDIFGLE